ncbi:Bug family tripartite tricarboxylate transporter substrate binding protein [Bordetella tumulicola]|uniref:Bug family tripartite tricarboxylate transporter substrate binding protein n=1 Tax=Bordetella tumulicola TaxID=1649133 RepID=UPI0039F10D79
MKTKRRLPRIKGLVAALSMVTVNAFAADFPSQPLHILIGFSPGGSNDLVARLIAPELSKELGQQIVIENKPGANGNIAADALLKATPDGHTLLICTSGFMSVQPYLYPSLRVKPATDILPVTLIGMTPYLALVNASVPVNSMQELIDYAKKHPGELSYASSGVGAAGHLVGEAVQHLAGVEFLHIPYKGTGQALADLVSGEVKMIFDQPISSYQYVKSGQLRALAAVNPKRLAAFPDIPSISESSSLPNFDLVPWTGLCAPKGTPQEAIDKVQQAVTKVLAKPEIAKRLSGDGVELVGNTSAEFATFLQEDRARWKRAAENAGIPPT